MKPRQRGVLVRISPDMVRMTLPIHHVDDLPHVARRLRQLADKLQLLHQANHLRPNQRLWEAYIAIREADRTIKRETPNDTISDD